MKQVIRICPKVKHVQYCWMHLIWFHKIALFVQFSLLVSYFLCNLHDNKVLMYFTVNDWLKSLTRHGNIKLLPDWSWFYIIDEWWGPWCQDGALFQCQLFNAFLNKLQTNFFPAKSWVFGVCTLGKSQRLLLHVRNGNPENHSVM